jgi:glycosyltransferase involved in cell wall biosynthesis
VPSAPAEGGGVTTLFIGLSAAGHGGIQAFNRRVGDALDRLAIPATTLMLADTTPEGGGFGGARLSFARAIVRHGRASEALLVGHVNLLPFALIYRLLNPRGRIILFAHGIEVWGDPAYRAVRWWEPPVLRRVVDRVAVVSEYSRGLMARAFGIGEDRFTLFPNAVDLAPPPRRPSQGGPTILAVTRLGRGERGKNVDALIRALPQVLRDVPDARLIVIGDGPLRNELGALAQELGIAGRVDLPGAVDCDRLDRAYASAATFALPSSKEGFGIVYLEAWASGLPVVGSTFGAAGELIDEGIDGHTVDPADVPALAGALIALLRDPAHAARMGAAGRAKVERRYSADAFVANLGALLSDTTRPRRTLR